MFGTKFYLLTVTETDVLLAPAEWVVLAFKEIRSGGGVKGHFPCV